MSARFSKLQEIDLTLDDPAGDEANRVDTESAGEGGTVELNLVEDPVFVPKWKFWNKPYKFRYDLAAAKRQWTQRRLCKRCRCTVNSWTAIIITLSVFLLAVVISVIISRVISEPPAETPTSVPSQFKGNLIIQAFELF